MLTVVGRIDGAGLDRVEELWRHGINARSVKRAVIVDLHRRDGYCDSWEIPSAAYDAEPRIEVGEYGGKGRGSAVVACGFANGVPLRPFCTLESEPDLPGSVHACFRVWSGVTTIRCYPHLTLFEIVEYQVVQDGKIVSLESKVWTGEIDPYRYRCVVCELPMSIDRAARGHCRGGSLCSGPLVVEEFVLPEQFPNYHAAVRAAHKKSMCEACECVHFARLRMPDDN